ncbi:hypothetical protein FRC12_024011 [Ceratobasidium sp. 428]|nr:hypothetical protein FRC12_024011 [Ceratobasidium sp. 428]
MPVPWEATIPFMLLTTMFAATGTLFNVSARFANDGKPPRYGLDTWEEMMMERDRRLTGSLRGQKVCLDDFCWLIFTNLIHYLGGSQSSRRVCYQQLLVHNASRKIKASTDAQMYQP